MSRPDVRQDGRVAQPDPDLLIEFEDVLVRRGGNVLVGPVTWKVELDERWVVLGPNGAGKTTLLRIAAAETFPTSGTAHVLGETFGRTDLSELRTRIGLSSAALANRVPFDEKVLDLVISAGYGVLGRWRERYELNLKMRSITFAREATSGRRSFATTATGGVS